MRPIGRAHPNASSVVGCACTPANLLFPAHAVMEAAGPVLAECTKRGENHA